MGFKSLALLPALVLAPMLANASEPANPSAAASAAMLPHRAVYDVKLKDQRSSSIEAVRGRIVYDFTGNSCEGYTLSFRQVTEIHANGDTNVSDLRTTTHESGDGKDFAFRSENLVNDVRQTEVVGTAKVDEGNAKRVTLTKPEERNFELPPAALFPVGQMQAIIAAAREGKTVYESTLYDGSDDGSKIYVTTALIGKPIGPEKPHETPVNTKPELLAIERWPVTISYFDATAGAIGEQTPLYSSSFDLYANGLSGDLTLDYGDFSMSATMAQLDLIPAKSCP